MTASTRQEVQPHLPRRWWILRALSTNFLVVIILMLLLFIVVMIIVATLVPAVARLTISRFRNRWLTADKPSNSQFLDQSLLCAARSVHGVCLFASKREISIARRVGQISSRASTVYSNMAFKGDFTPVLAKRSKFSLFDCISVGVD
jgi:hypothetical protein